MLHRSESLLTLWQHHSLGILWCNTKTGLSRNNRQCYGKSYRTEPQNISVPEMHKNTVHMFLKRGMLVMNHGSLAAANRGVAEYELSE